jgi:predicted transcriptional regulator of viral defense system
MHGQIENFVDATQATGRYAFDTEEVRGAVTLSPEGVRAALRRLEDRGRIVRPSARRGIFVIVPPEYRTIGAPPSAWWLDAFMRHIERPDYYVGLLTAAEWHGSAHYAVQEMQVVVSKQLRPVRVGRERIHFVTNSYAARTPVESRAFDAGSVRVSTPEATAVDVVRYAKLVGGPSRVATVLSGLSLSPRALSHAVEVAGDVTAAQRLGFLLEVAGQRAASRAVARYLETHEHRARPLVPGASTEDAAIAARWDVVVNAPVEVG